jgi:hypothetical protein
MEPADQKRAGTIAGRMLSSREARITSMAWWAFGLVLYPLVLALTTVVGGTFAQLALLVGVPTQSDWAVYTTVALAGAIAGGVLGRLLGRARAPRLLWAVGLVWTAAIFARAAVDHRALEPYASIGSSLVVALSITAVSWALTAGLALGLRSGGRESGHTPRDVDVPDWRGRETT